MPAYKQVKEVRHNLGIGPEFQLVSERLKVSFVDPVGGYLAVVDD